MYPEALYLTKTTIPRRTAGSSSAAGLVDFYGGDFQELSACYAVPIPGAEQAYNAAAALMAAKTAAPGLNADTARSALAGIKLPARFERLSVPGHSETVLIADGAHTPESVKRCAETFCKLYGEGGILVFGCAKEKDVEGMAEILVPRFSAVIITAPGTFRTSDPEAVYAAFQDTARQGGAAITLISDTAAAFEEALRAGNAKKLPLLCCGSFYLAGEIRARFATPQL